MRTAGALLGISKPLSLGFGTWCKSRRCQIAEACPSVPGPQIPMKAEEQSKFFIGDKMGGKRFCFVLFCFKLLCARYRLTCFHTCIIAKNLSVNKPGSQLSHFLAT